jgi:uncharacterized membrane-anchored protein
LHAALTRRPCRTSRCERPWLRGRAAFILIRPLGATLGDTLTKRAAEGGLHLGRIVSSLAIAFFNAACVWLLPQRAGSRTGQQPATP